MATFYLTLLVLGGVTLGIQLVLGFAGAVSDGDIGGGEDADGLDLFTVRALAAAAAAFGAVGLGLMQVGVPA